jgi:alpha-D-ribose 1-methylphosphonate 5-triphosphate synthase subunit PhnH
MESQLIYNEVFDAQEHYRLLLDSLSRPGKINTIPFLEIQQPAAINNAGALIAFSLLNTDATFHAIGETAVSDFIALHTSAKIAALQQADFIFIPGTQDVAFIAELKTGTLSYPEDSATIVADVLEISDSPISGALKITLKGPGILGVNIVYVNGLNPAILDELKERNLEFPLGIDLFLTDRDNRVIGIPRSNDFIYVPTGDQSANS